MRRVGGGGRERGRSERKCERRGGKGGERSAEGMGEHEKPRGARDRSIRSGGYGQSQAWIECGIDMDERLQSDPCDAYVLAESQDRYVH